MTSEQVGVGALTVLAAAAVGVNVWRTFTRRRASGNGHVPEARLNAQRLHRGAVSAHGPRR